MDNIDWGEFLFKFDGRINRAKFWIGVAIMYVVPWVLLIIAAAINSSFVWILVSLIVLVMIWPGLAISIKRWHDRDKSGWWILIGLIPLVGPIWALIETGFLPGTEGTNQYGPDPLA
jgi:uncharacterized membrane protein YhaH (DUF805 family)